MTTLNYFKVGASYVRICIKVGTSYFERCQSSKLVWTGYIRAPHWFLGTHLAMATACSCLECDVSFCVSKLEGLLQDLSL